MPPCGRSLVGCHLLNACLVRGQCLGGVYVGFTPPWGVTESMTLKCCVQTRFGAWVYFKEPRTAWVNLICSVAAVSAFYGVRYWSLFHTPACLAFPIFYLNVRLISAEHSLDARRFCHATTYLFGYTPFTRWSCIDELPWRRIRASSRSKLGECLQIEHVWYCKHSSSWTSYSY